MIGIQCKGGKVFSAIVEGYVDAEWKIQEAFYRVQGCTIITKDEIKFEKCECDHCKSLEHGIEALIEELVNQTELNMQEKMGDY